MKTCVKNLLIGFVLLTLAAQARAGQVEIVKAEVQPGAPGMYRFDVTLRHADTGWAHYADLWQVELADGTILAKRVLYHPHVNEQPFTRSQSVSVPKGVTEVFVRAHDKEHGWSDQVLAVMLGN